MRTRGPRMRRKGVCFLQGLLWTAWILWGGTAHAGMMEGDPVQPFALEKRGGGTFRFPEDAEGKVVFLDFWASWCPECKTELPELVALKKTFGNRPFLLVCVNVDRQRKAADKFLDKLGLDVPVLYDNDQKLVNSFRPVGVPASFLVGPAGRVQKVYLGFRKDSMDVYRRDIGELVGVVERERAATVPAGPGDGAPAAPTPENRMPAGEGP
jgi:thiol-disulfide isomerase/thioredoxin